MNEVQLLFSFPIPHCRQVTGLLCVHTIAKMISWSHYCILSTRTWAVSWVCINDCSRWATFQIHRLKSGSQYFCLQHDVTRSACKCILQCKNRKKFYSCDVMCFNACPNHFISTFGHITSRGKILWTRVNEVLYPTTVLTCNSCPTYFQCDTMGLMTTLTQ